MVRELRSGEGLRARSHRQRDRIGGVRQSHGDRPDVESVPVVPCSEPHDAEVYAETELPEGDYPGDEAIQATIRVEMTATERDEPVTIAPPTR